MKKGGAPAADDPARQASIKTKTVVRNVKDYNSYVAELQKEKHRLKTFESTDPDKVSQQTKVIEEASMMIPNARNRIRTTLDDLVAFLKEAHEALSGSGEVEEAAQAAVKSAEAILAAQEEA